MKRFMRKIMNLLIVVLLAGCILYAWVYSDELSHSEVLSDAFVYEDIPAYSGTPAAEVNQNVPFFSAEDLLQEEFVTYGDTDFLGRCTQAYGLLGRDMMPEVEREEKLTVDPSGWHSARYDDLIEDHFLFHRCHLIAFELTGENDNRKNLITGTGYMNIEGMLPYENQCASYIRRTGNHVLYRVTPVFLGNELVCRGVLIEAESVEDDVVRFCVFCYNVQPGIEINYLTGNSQRE